MSVCIFVHLWVCFTCAVTQQVARTGLFQQWGVISHRNLRSMESWSQLYGAFIRQIVAFCAGGAADPRRQKGSRGTLSLFLLQGYFYSLVFMQRINYSNLDSILYNGIHPNARMCVCVSAGSDPVQTQRY